MNREQVKSVLDNTQKIWLLAPVRMLVKLRMSEFTMLSRINAITRQGERRTDFSNAQIMNEMPMSKATATRTVASLESKGIIGVDFVSDRHGVRRRYIWLTPFGMTFIFDDKARNKTAAYELINKRIVNYQGWLDEERKRRGGNVFPHSPLPAVAGRQRRPTVVSIARYKKLLAEARGMREQIAELGGVLPESVIEHEMELLNKIESMVLESGIVSDNAPESDVTPVAEAVAVKPVAEAAPAPLETAFIEPAQLEPEPVAEPEILTEPAKPAAPVAKLGDIPPAPEFRGYVGSPEAAIAKPVVPVGVIPPVPASCRKENLARFERKAEPAKPAEAQPVEAKPVVAESKPVAEPVAATPVSTPAPEIAATPAKPEQTPSIPAETVKPAVPTAPAAPADDLVVTTPESVIAAAAAISNAPLMETEQKPKKTARRTRKPKTAFVPPSSVEECEEAFKAFIAPLGERYPQLLEMDTFEQASMFFSYWNDHNWVDNRGKPVVSLRGRVQTWSFMWRDNYLKREQRWYNGGRRQPNRVQSQGSIFGNTLAEKVANYNLFNKTCNEMREQGLTPSMSLQPAGQPVNGGREILDAEVISEEPAKLPLKQPYGQLDLFDNEDFRAQV